MAEKTEREWVAAILKEWADEVVLRTSAALPASSREVAVGAAVVSSLHAGIVFALRHSDLAATLDIATRRAAGSLAAPADAQADAIAGAMRKMIADLASNGPGQ